ncbi:RNA-binding cell elongation regulator Jag/EloR [Heyndrickxia oleronia]|uniref:RNA-binding protein KhpB n=1 Tax=Heyndrickxia oleronia TaxID=38875 RepID=A0A8E2IAG2_9BACI|nr:RNA-binding cell elongation regulator Jag/EloR [Heyndrickxia oleronia]NYV66325.1 protein jag [Bacillus sp. Gen3]OJH19835.1 protein jag [Bacillus obstructivus]MBU5211468.1 protein jag [Heyndrickxia oleronia]MEC1374513.1 RNA-binding cell elongation regulator Jag/EloR [Heyndrickxia oleronia]OOP69716.1 protein jag [Heyndrickxia oleronia]
MKEYTAKGHSVEEAVESALRELNVTKERIEYQVIDEGKKGLFGLFGSKPAIVHVQLKPDPIEEAKIYLVDVIKKMGIDPHIEIKTEGKIAEFKITGKNMALLIGKRGQTLNSLQVLTQLIANRYTNQFINIVLDAENYRERREYALIQLAERLAEKAVYTKRPVTLEAMPSFERKIIHNALSRNKKIQTHSEGEEPNRYLVIHPVVKNPSN